jgi:S1-C subfamily serine protease
MLLRSHPLDVLLGLVLIAAAISGWRRGFMVVVLGYAGLLAGLAVGAWAASRVGLVVSSEDSLRRIFTGIAVFFLVAAFCHAVATRLGSVARDALVGQWTSSLDSLGGAVVATGVTAVALWFVGLTLSSSMPQLARAVANSVILTTIDEHAPRPPGALAELRGLLARSPFPEAFAGLRPPLTSGEPPAVARTPGIARARDATVQVESEGCGGLLFGSGFPVPGNLVVTNAHVVAGTSNHRVRVNGGRAVAATVVWFDPKRDLALLRAPGLGLRPLTLRDAQPPTPGAVIGYPGGGREQVVGAQVVSRTLARGRDIYSRSLVTRQIYILRAAVRKGDSGGPVVDRAGHALGVVFAASTVDGQEGFALTNVELRAALSAAGGRTAAAPTGACAA